MITWDRSSKIQTKKTNFLCLVSLFSVQYISKITWPKENTKKAEKIQVISSGTWIMDCILPQGDMKGKIMVKILQVCFQEINLIQVTNLFKLQFLKTEKKISKKGLQKLWNCYKNFRLTSKKFLLECNKI